MILTVITLMILASEGKASSIKNLNSVSSHLGLTYSLIPPDGNSKIQVALLFDTSNSMDGLIEQAKSRLWDIVNTLTTLKYQGKTPVIEIALYEYGNDGLSVRNNYIRQVTALTTDLDLISEKLFALKTNGANTMKLVYIAGNESFNQGNVNYKEVISSAVKSNIYINTIFCGDKKEGISLLWEDGAAKGKGKYFNIDSDVKIEYIQTPYDSQINACNDKLNKTYIGYGKQGHLKKQSQVKEDANASSISQANATERVLTKSKAVYKNSTWDLVDNVKDNESNLDKIKKEDLPEEYKNKSKEEIKTLVLAKAKERDVIQKEIGALAVKRQKYIAEKSNQNTKQDDLGSAIKSSIITLASIKGYKVET